MDNKTHGPTNPLNNTYGDEITKKSTSTQRKCVIEQLYKILPQDNKRQERNELKKINA